MGDDGVRSDDRPVAEPCRPQGEIGVLPVHEESRVEASELEPDASLGEQETAGDDVHLADAVALPAAERLGVEQRRLLEDRGQHRGEAGQAPDGGPAPARPGIHGSVGIERAAAVDPVLRALAREAHEALDRTWMHDGVRVQEEHELAGSFLRGAIHARRKPDVFVERHDAHLGKLGRHHLDRAVVRRVVEDDDLEARLGGRAIERCEALPRFVTTAVRDDDDRDVDRRGAHRARARRCTA